MKCIWLNKAKYCRYMKSYQTMFSDKTGFEFCAAEFKHNYKFDKKILKIKLEVCADTKYVLNINGEPMGTGPICRGGDYGYEKSLPYTYSDIYEIEINDKNLSFAAEVRLLPAVMAETSLGLGRFALECDAELEDGTHEIFSADETWLSRRNTYYESINNVDFTKREEEWTNSSFVAPFPEIRHSPLPKLAEEKIMPDEFSAVTVVAKESRSVTVTFDKIYSGYALLNVSAKDKYNITVNFFEVPEQPMGSESITADSDIKYKSLRMHSIGGYTLNVENIGNADVIITEAALMFEHYPITNEGRFKCSDEVLNKIYEVGKHTLSICRQSIELDSPSHQENLGCTGDYFIESLVNYFTFGDTRLTRLDILRTAEYLKITGGKMFHTTYSLIWVQMIYDYYMFSGDTELLGKTAPSVKLLLERFLGYVGDNGLVENPPNFMFVDWIYEDGYSLHHPPKALGQTVMNAFYYKALLTAEQIFKVLGDGTADIYNERAEKLYAEFNAALYDSERGLYFDGLNTPSEANDWLPKNSEKRYYSMHSNTLAVLYGLCPKSEEKRIMTAVLENKSLITVQPYFMHFVLEAVYSAGLFEKYGINQILRYGKLVEECDKGLKEGWIDMPGYGYDYSHAWGATPTYQLPSKLLGFKIIEAGFEKISLSPKLYGLEYADISVPTPYGNIRCVMDKDGVKTEIPEKISIL